MPALLSMCIIGLNPLCAICAHMVLKRLGRMELVYAKKNVKLMKKQIDEKRIERFEQDAMRFSQNIGRVCGGMGDMMR